MTCFYCGTELPAGAMFCGECGRPVNTKGGRSPKAAASRAATTPEPAPLEEPEPSAPADARAAASRGRAVPEPAVVDAVSASQGQAAPAPTEPSPAEPSPAEASPAEPSPAEPSLAEPSLAEQAPAEPTPAQVDPRRAAPTAAPSAPEPVAPAEPAAPVAAPDIEPDLAASSVAAPATDPAVPSARCAQCGAPLAASDIFCPECGFVRQREGARSRPSDTNILDPFPWGLPRSTEPVAHQHPAPSPAPAEAPAPQFAEIADVSETRLVPRGPRGDRFVLQFSTGESVSVSGTGLIGRNPMGEPGEYFDTLVAIVDPGRSVSKTHLEFGQDGTSFWVSDRYSGNGTVVREPDSEPRRCDAGKRYRVTRGTRVEIGEQFFIVS